MGLYVANSVSSGAGIRLYISSLFSPADFSLFRQSETLERKYVNQHLKSSVLMQTVKVCQFSITEDALAHYINLSGIQPSRTELKNELV